MVSPAETNFSSSVTPGIPWPSGRITLLRTVGALISAAERRLAACGAFDCAAVPAVGPWTDPLVGLWHPAITESNSIIVRTEKRVRSFKSAGSSKQVLPASQNAGAKLRTIDRHRREFGRPLVRPTRVDDQIVRRVAMAPMLGIRV